MRGQAVPGPKQLRTTGNRQHERGAFTGATSRRIGWLEEAGVGTLLLDDFHRMRLDTQVLLLRALDRRAFRRLGLMRDLGVLCRVIIGLGESPAALVRQGRLLPEFLYRLGFCEIRLLPLAERREDIAALAVFFLKGAPAETGGNVGEAAALLDLHRNTVGRVKKELRRRDGTPAASGGSEP